MIKTTKKKGNIVASTPSSRVTYRVPYGLSDAVPWRHSDDHLHAVAAFMLAKRLSLFGDTPCKMDSKRINGTTRIHTIVPA